MHSAFDTCTVRTAMPLATAMDIHKQAFHTIHSLPLRHFVSSSTSGFKPLGSDLGFRVLAG